MIYTIKFCSVDRYKFLFVVLLLLSFSVCSQSTDISILRKVHLDRNQNLDNTFKLISSSGLPVVCGTPLTILAIGFIEKDKSTIQTGLVLGSAFVLNGALTTGLKFVVNRPRPFVTYPDIQKLSPAGRYSFPSGHTSSAFAFATSMILAYPKWYVVAPSYLWASVVAYSRMHLGVHYPSDLLGGILVGVGVGLLTHVLGKQQLTEY